MTDDAKWGRPQVRASARCRMPSSVRFFAASVERLGDIDRVPQILNFGYVQTRADIFVAFCKDFGITDLVT